MSIHFSVHERVNLKDKDAPRKFYPIAKSSGNMNLKQISNRIASMSTVNSGDVLAVLDLLVQVMKEELANGNIISLGDFGSFIISLSATGSDTAEAVSAASINHARLKFRPGEDLRNMLLTFKYVKVSTPSVV